jgi:uncharacterized protein YkwD
MLLRVGILVCLLTICGLHDAKVASASLSGQVAGKQYDRFVLQLINRDRAAARIPEVRLSRRLGEIALAHSMDMARRHYFSHFTPAGESPSDRLTQSGIGFHINGENLGRDSGHDIPTMLRAIDGAMLQSPIHRETLLSPAYLRVGIGVVVTGGDVFVTEDYTG